jgi:hypothetical protein
LLESVSTALQWITMDNHGYPFGFWMSMDKPNTERRDVYRLKALLFLH